MILYNDHLKNKSLLSDIQSITESTGTKEIEILTFLYTGGKETQSTKDLTENVGKDRYLQDALKSLSAKSFIVESSRGYSITRRGLDYLLTKHPELKESVDENDEEEDIDEGLITKAAAVGAIAGKVAKKTKDRASTSGRADAAEKKADKRDKKKDDKERLKKSKKRLRKKAKSQKEKDKKKDESYIEEKASQDDVHAMMYIVQFADDNMESTLEKEWGNNKTFQATLQRAMKLGYLKKDGQAIDVTPKGKKFIQAMEESVDLDEASKGNETFFVKTRGGQKPKMFYKKKQAIEYAKKNDGFVVKPKPGSKDMETVWSRWSDLKAF